ncbi:glycoside hydrolase family 32 protein [Bacillus sp. 03113]|uniref:glycoside hydrolase family 32 protein n=1 Tax=Bacillus sp. 03113 TaxID=2578211 RepID=UPI0011421F2F|nr:glycoside hydrolase family 32 protein [Bacillus sp. 03113]
MTENFRPLYHITPPSEWMSDVQRPIYINGVHHFYYLYNKDFSIGENGTEWRHATSTDLVHWKDEGVAIHKYGGNPAGDPWTGSAVVDTNNTAGFGAGAIIALVTMPPEYQSTHLWYSTDNGNSFSYYGLVQYNPTGNADFRDPKVIWHEPTQKWVMLMAELDKIGFYTSTNLKDWVYVSSFVRQDIGIIECPDLFQINVDDDPNYKKWVLMPCANGFNYGHTSGSAYFIGEFDGISFTPDPGTDVQWLDHGTDCYTGVTWDAPYCNGNYRFYIAWMTNWEYTRELPYENYIGNATIVRELRLKSTTEGLRMFQTPIWGIRDNFQDISFWGDQIITSQQAKILDGVTSYSIESSFHIDDLTNGLFGISVRDGNGTHTDITYDKELNELVFNRSQSGLIIDDAMFTKPRIVKNVFPLNGKIKLDIFVDRSTVEIFVNDGAYVLSNLIFPQLSSDELRLWTNDTVHLEYFKVKTLNQSLIG